jgi:hypothetical protein
MAILSLVARQARVAGPVLCELCRRSRGKGASDAEFDEVMADLECDWYLRLDPATNEFYFRLKIMREWWQRWYPARATQAKRERSGQR